MKEEIIYAKLIVVKLRSLLSSVSMQGISTDPIAQ